MNTSGLFEKNGWRWQPSGFENFNKSTGEWEHSSKNYFMAGGNWFGVYKVGKQYIPAITLHGGHSTHGEPALTLSTAKKRALILAIDNDVVKLTAGGHNADRSVELLARGKD